VTNDAQLKIASNLSDLNNAGTARTNLGLGDSAVKKAINALKKADTKIRQDALRILESAQNDNTNFDEVG